MKGLAESSPFHLLTNPHVINRFIFGHGVVIYYLLEHTYQLLKTELCSGKEKKCFGGSLEKRRNIKTLENTNMAAHNQIT